MVHLIKLSSHKPADDVKVPDDTVEKKLDIMLKHPLADLNNVKDMPLL